MIVHMCKLQIVTLDAQFPALLEGLQHLAYLHLEPVSLGATGQPGQLHRMHLTPADEERRQVLADARRLLGELRGILGEFSPPAPDATAPPSAGSPPEIRAAAEEMLRKVRSLLRRRRNLEQDRGILRHYMRMGDLLPRVGPAGEESTLLMFTFPSEERMVARALPARLQALSVAPLRIHLFHVTGGPRVAAVVCPSERAADVRQAAWRAGTLEFKLPLAYREQRLDDSFRRIHDDLEAMPARLAELEQRFAKFRQQAGHYAALLDQLCAEEVQRLDSMGNFFEGSLLRVLHAYVPVDRKEEVIHLAEELTGNRLEVVELPLGPRLEDVPVVLRNPAIARPFEILLRIFPPPTYGTLDPTIATAIGVPFFFGLIVGDIGYGLVILALALWMRRRFRQRETLAAMATVGAYCAASTIVFGFLYGELFGSLGPRLGLRPLLHREDPQAMLLLLKIAVSLGALHVGLGLLFGMLNARHVLDRHAFYERLGQLLCLVSLLLTVAALFLASGWLAVPAGICLAVGLAVLLRGAGVVGLLEVFSLVSNILSYSRLMALGVASVVLAMVANRLFDRLDYGLVGLVVAVMLHGLNIMIAMISPTIHTLRLHYVEFFTKFYRPEGKTYVAFGTRAGPFPP